MKFLKIFITLLKVLRVFLVLMLVFTLFSAVVELFFPSSNIHTFFSHDDPSMYDDSYFSKNLWLTITSLSIGIISLLLFKSCGKLLSTMNRFKNQEYFIDENAKNFKSSGIYFLLALVIVPAIINILHGMDYLLSLRYAESGAEKYLPDWVIRMSIFIGEKFPGLLLWLLVGLFLFVMGEVIQRAVDVKQENDLTI